MIGLSLIVAILITGWFAHSGATLLAPLVRAYADFIHQHVRAVAVFQGWLGLFLLFIPPFILLFSVDFLLKGLLYGIPAWFFETVLLILSIGLMPFYQDFFQKGKNVWAILKEPFAPNQVTCVDTQSELISDSRVAIYQNVFSVFFWFLCLGGAGALIYRILVIAENEAKASSASLHAYHLHLSKLVEYLDWLPLRCLGLGLGLMGNFLSVIGVYFHQFKQVPQQNIPFINTLYDVATEKGEGDNAISMRVIWLLLLCLGLTYL